MAAAPLEALVLDRIRRFTRTGDVDWPRALRLIQRVELQEAAIHIVAAAPKSSAGDMQEAAPTASDDKIIFEGRGKGRCVRIVVPGRPCFRGGRSWLTSGQGDRSTPPKLNVNLIRGLRNAHDALTALQSAPLTNPAELPAGRAPDEFQSRRIAPLAFLAPDIQRAIFEGRQPAGLTMLGMLEKGIPLLWSEQRRAFGFDV